MQKPYTIVQSDNWVGFYYRGELIAEGHSLSIGDVLDATGHAYETRYADQKWLDDNDYMPKFLTDVKEA